MEKLRLKEARLKKLDDQWLKSRNQVTRSPEKINQRLVQAAIPSSQFVIEHPRATIDGDLKGASFYPVSSVVDGKEVVELYFYSGKRKRFRQKEHYSEFSIEK